MLYRETVRGVAFRRGLWASLAPKPIPDQAGNGTHLHASLIDLGSDGTPGGRNAFADPADRNGLSQVGYHFIGGLLAHLPALVALTCASVNSYRRLAPQMWASAYTCYGMDNREAAIRICSPLRGDPGSSVNLELKPSDSSANPYLALGAFVYAGLDGIRSKLDPGEAVNVDPATLTDAERAASNTHRLPASLNAALDALAADELLMDLLGPLRSRGLPRGQALGSGPLRPFHRPLLRVLRALHQDLSMIVASSGRIAPELATIMGEWRLVAGGQAALAGVAGAEDGFR